MFYQYYLYFQNKVTKQGLSKGCTFISKEVTTEGSNLWGMFSREKSIYAFRKAKKESYIFISQVFPSLGIEARPSNQEPHELVCYSIDPTVGEIFRFRKFM